MQFISGRAGVNVLKNSSEDDRALKLELETNQLGINTLYLVLENNLEYHQIALSAMIESDLISLEDATEAHKIIAELTYDLRSQIARQYPVVVSETDQIMEKGKRLFGDR